MKMKKINVTETIVADIQLHIVQNGSGGPVIFWGMYPHQGGEVEHFWEALMELVPEQNFLLVAFQVEDWNRDFSPWEAPAAFGTEAFDGQGARTLKWLLEEGVPYKDLCLLEYAPENETEQAVLLTEWENFAKVLLASCTEGKLLLHSFWHCADQRCIRCKKNRGRDRLRHKNLPHKSSNLLTNSLRSAK